MRAAASPRLTFSTGRVNSFLYDDNDNPIVLSRSGSGPPTISQLAYDPEDRVAQYTDAFSKTVRYTYDPDGRLTNVTYPDGKALTQAYDALRRMTRQVFQFGPLKTFTNTYAYDQASRLIRRTYPNGMVQTNTFDNAGRLTGLSHAALTPQPSTLDIAMSYAYDRNGNTTMARQEGVFQWPKPALLDETSGFTDAGRITNRVDRLNPTNHFTYRHDENGNMTNAFGAGQSWTLTYDEDNRTTSLCWSNGVLNDVILTNRYDALGRRIAKTRDGLQMGYVLDLAGRMERILCDLSPSRTITAWYVHGPDLAFKVTPDGSLTCYHADPHGNIIALTDGNAVTAAEYAYTPYGRSLGRTNTPSQAANPYLFAGSKGVMEDLPGLFFMRARYYSAEAGVFLSTEPIRHVGPTWRPMPHAYAFGNPLRYTDPTGEWPVLEQAWAAVREFAVGAWAEIRSEAQQAWKRGKEFAEGTWENIKGLPGDLRDLGRAAWEEIKSLPGDIWDTGKAAWEDVKSMAEWVWGAAQDVWDFINDPDPGKWEETGQSIVNWVEKEVVGGAVQIWQEDLQPAIEEVWQTTKSTAKSAWNWIKSIF